MTFLLGAMGTTQVVIFLGICVIAITVGLVASVWRVREMNETVRTLADRLGASVVEGRMFSEPSVEFRIGGRPAWMEFFAGGRDGHPYTRVVVDVRGQSPGSLHIVPEGFGDAFLKIFGAQDLTVGDPDFDSKYVVRATPETLALQVFRPEQRNQAITSILRLKELATPSIDLDQTHLTVQTREYVTDERRLMKLAKGAEEFLTYVFSIPGAAGVQFLDMQVSGEGRCPVCGTGMRGPTVRCEFCRTPHHAECWKYMGRCSTYACKGRRSVA